MIIAAHAVGAAHGIVYLRAEYAYLREYLEAQLAELREEGLLGNRFDVRIQLGAGSYVCGDESALIESCEGKRGTPRLKPPFPVEFGFLGKPTAVDNVETFAAAVRIMDRGADWFAAMGTSESKGTRLLSVSGDCAAPGIYEVRWGITLGEALEMVGAEDPRAVQISGPAGEMVSASADADRRLAFEDISCGGSFMIFNTQRDLLSVVRDFMQFFVDESCGICVPCRAGGLALRQKVELVIAGRADQVDLDEMVDWGGLLANTSRCGLGTTAPNPILSTLVKFPEIYAERLNHRHTKGRANNMTLHTNWARTIEIIHAAEIVRDLLLDPDIQKDDLVVTPGADAWTGEGVGVVEAPRGSLLHHYRADRHGSVTFANLIVATTQNNEVLNRTIRSVADDYLDGQAQITEGMMNAIEVGIRA